MYLAVFHFYTAAIWLYDDVQRARMRLFVKSTTGWIRLAIYSATMYPLLYLAHAHAQLPLV